MFLGTRGTNNWAVMCGHRKEEGNLFLGMKGRNKTSVVGVRTRTAVVVVVVVVRNVPGQRHGH